MFAGEKQAAAYGATSEPVVDHLGAPELGMDGEPTILKSTARKRMNLMPIVASWIVPCALFCAMYWLLTCESRWRHPNWGIHVALWGLLLVFVVGAVLGALFSNINIGNLGVVILRGGTSQDLLVSRRRQEPTWSIFLFLALLLAWLLAIILGQVTFGVLSQYYEAAAMSHYSDVQTTATSGAQFMDAGSVTFAAGAKLDLSKAMGFKNGHVYCVAPITTQGENQTLLPASQDWWAVGVDCCDPDGTEFVCDGASDPHYNGGLRLMDNNKLYYYMLALKEAKVAYDIATVQPLFFHWAEDPLDIIDGYKLTGDSQFILWVCIYCIFQAVLVLITAIAFDQLLRPTL